MYVQRFEVCSEEQLSTVRLYPYALERFEHEAVETQVAPPCAPRGPGKRSGQGVMGGGPGAMGADSCGLKQSKNVITLWPQKDSSTTSATSCPTGSGQWGRAGSPGGGPGAIGGWFLWSQTK